jgi:hypothetical protein
VRLKSAEGVELNFGLDTGAKSTSIRENIIAKVTGERPTDKTITLRSAGGAERVESKVLQNLELVLDGHRLTFENIATNPSDPAAFIKLDGVLGSDISKNAAIRIDYQNGVFDYRLVK